MSVGVNSLTSILYLHALRDAPLSLALPLLKLSPMFILITGPLTTGEHIPPLGIAGVLITVAGTYVLNFGERSAGLLKPFTVLWHNRGMRSMLLVAVLWGVSAPWDKVGLRASGPLTWLLVVNVGLTLSLLPPALSKAARPSLREWRRTAPIALFHVLSVTCQMWALLYAPVQYVISMKRLSSLFGMVWGYLFFRERDLSSRLTGAIFIFLGMVAILAAR